MSKVLRKITRCEDLSPTIKKFRSSKNHGKIRIINDLTYQQIGDDILYCFKTSRILKLVSIE
jgi:hypothetical protein